MRAFSRSDLEQEENQRLACFAMKNSQSKGRKFAQAKDEFRLDFQRDRDRVLHCKAFRRLKGKTQVFVAHHGDHFRSRLTHTLEVAQISISLARNLRANEDLAQTIALAHDLGHTPFGHTGEAAMNDLLHRFGKEFEHNAQSRRVVETLEKKYPQFPGLNLTFEVLEGLHKHRTPHDLRNKKLSQQAFLEAQIVDLADEIAYQNHDLEDGLNSGILRFAEVAQLEVFQMLQERLGQSISQDDFQIGALINLMVSDVLLATCKNLQSAGVTSPDAIRNFPSKMVAFSPQVENANNHLRHFLQTKFYRHETVADQSRTGFETVKKLFFHFQKNPNRLPDDFQKSDEPREILIKDFIAGMTDDFALRAVGECG